MYKVINNYKINAFQSKEEFLEQIINEKKILIAMNAEKIVKKDKTLIDIVNNNIGYPDGFGAVIALRRNGLKSIKIAGSEFWLEIIQKFYKTKSFYLIGSTSEIIEKTIIKLKKEYPNINIIGYQNGFLKDGDKEKLITNLQKKQPDIIFVAQGSPKQELLMNDLNRAYSALYMGLGGSFDIYGGNKKRAPLFFLKFELEWFYRLLQEPTRIGRQLALIKFFILMTKQKTSKPFS
jgi:UDP-N-acetyl-D-mannosaminouronate:lipid I N-acetyl-D-mannosaminouronosyltransferase